MDGIISDRITTRHSMKLDWDYTHLAQAYLKRPAYAEDAIDVIVSCSGIGPGTASCDMGAGTGKLTLPLLERGLAVTAVEPNDAMRGLGIRETSRFPNVTWIKARAEQSGLPDASFRLVTFGSSFPVTDQPEALRQVHRLLEPGGWLAMVVNHRDLEDPVQKAIEKVIHQAIPDYHYGKRRNDQTAPIGASGLFGEVQQIAKQVVHHERLENVVEAWRSHATLQRQAGDAFDDIVAEIERVLQAVDQPNIAIPYTTRLWLAQVEK